MTLVEPGDPAALAAPSARRSPTGTASRPRAVGRAPGRVNLIGEHTDYNAGLVPAGRAPPRDVRRGAGPAPTTWSGSPAASRTRPGRARSASSGRAPVEGWAGYAAGVVWALREAGHEVPGVDLLVDSRVPGRRRPVVAPPPWSARSASRCSALLGVELTTDEARRTLVDAAIRAETEVVGAPTGGMDQTVAMLGEAGAALLIDFDTHETTPVPLDLAGHTLLVTDTRVSHALTDGGYGSRRADCEAAADGARRRHPAAGRPSTRWRPWTTTGSAAAPPTWSPRSSGSPTPSRRWPRATGTRWAGSSTPRTARCATTSRSPAPSSTCAVAVAVQAGAVAARMTGGGFGGSSVAVVPGRAGRGGDAGGRRGVRRWRGSAPLCTCAPCRPPARRRARLSRRTQPGSGTPAGVGAR